MHDFFKNKVVAITGGTSGIGLATSSCFLRAGAKVAVCGIEKDFEENEETKKMADGKVDNAMAMVADVTKTNEIEKFIDTATDKLGQINIFYNNAGVYDRFPSIEVTDDDWEKIISINLKSYFFAAQAMAKRWIDKKLGGCIINTASINARDVEPEAQVYCVSKAGVVMLTKCLAADWGQYGIRVNAVAPGTIPTTLNEDLYSDEEREELGQSLPLKRLGTPEDIAEAVMFLASDNASYITGQVIFVDGGWLLVK
ncbi:MAG: SDR family oxidoreductase [Planctomycetaceae bacterium]|nr:SDR family oxidoreductase [Planctomycetaceae bacterium]